MLINFKDWCDLMVKVNTIVIIGLAVGAAIGLGLFLNRRRVFDCPIPEPEHPCAPITRNVECNDGSIFILKGCDATPQCADLSCEGHRGVRKITN